jgi:F-type H+-transporting ATPase subunit f
MTLLGKALGAAPDAMRMQRVVNFYEKLPRGHAPELKATGLLGRYQAKHFGNNPSAKRTFWHPTIT